MQISLTQSGAMVSGNCSTYCWWC